MLISNRFSLVVYPIVDYRGSDKNTKAMESKSLVSYWKTNLRYLIVLCVSWFIVGFGGALLFVDSLNQIHIGGLPLGFWFAMQGAILMFVVMMFVYVWLMNRLDARYGVDEE